MIDVEGATLWETTHSFDRATCIAWSHDRTRLYVGGTAGKIDCCDAATGASLWQITTDGCQVSTIAISPDGKKLATGGFDHELVLVDTQDGNVTNRLAGHHDIVRCVDFLPESGQIVTASLDGTVRLWTPEGQFLRRAL